MNSVATFFGPQKVRRFFGSLELPLFKIHVQKKDAVS